MMNSNANKPKVSLTPEQQALVSNNVSLVRKFITVRTHEYMKDDLMSAGYEGLCKAATMWNPEKGTFSTYAAIWIKALVYDQFRKFVTIQTINSRAGRKLYYAIPAAQRDFQLKHGREPTPQELSVITGESLDEIRTMMVVRCKVMGLTEEMNDDQQMVRLVSPHDLEAEIMETNLRDKRREAYLQARATLKPRDQIIIARRHTAHDEQESFKDIAENLGITRERVRQVNDRAVIKLKKTVLESYPNLVD